MKSIRVLLVAVALVVSFAVAAVAEPIGRNNFGHLLNKVESFAFVVDYSGSMMMNNSTLNQPKITIAKKIMAAVNDKIPDLDYSAGLYAVTPYSAIVNQGSWDRMAMSQGIHALSEDNPIFGRMTYLGTDMKNFDGIIGGMPRGAAIILLSDGNNNLGTDLVEEVSRIYSAQPDVCFHIISFADSKKGKATLDRVAALKPCTVYVEAKDLALDPVAIEKFVKDIFYEQPEMIVQRTVNFASASYALDAQAKAILDEVAFIVTNKPRGTRTVQVQGFTDNRGGWGPSNLRLSENRAKAVREYILGKGVNAELVYNVGHGVSYKNDNRTKEGRAENRRVDLLFN